MSILYKFNKFNLDGNNTIKYQYACLYLEFIRKFKLNIEENQMVNLALEILFWTILITYIGARLTQTKNGFKQEY